jgi:class 3 adenylate cyclase/tetratricopeptide (TPR) repeat protein
MQQISDWLEKLGMSEYAQLFAENRIDLSVLPELTDQHLNDLGLPLGDRLKMLGAIRELSGATSLPPQLERRPQDTAERRQVTVMFSDLVGSTALSGRMDPEDLREIISAYQRCVADMVRRFGGFVAKYMGDGVLVYFGYPQAHEDDAERAVRAGLELITAVASLKAPVRLQVRVGIATGVVVVGDLIGSGEAQERGIVGETPNLAARLQAVATPNMVVIADDTRKLLGDLFELQGLGTQDLKGIKGSAGAWAVLRPGSVESRFEALHASALTPLVGREEELELLLRRWSRAKNGEGQVVLLSGEAGIGKSRLTAALLESLAPEPHTRLRHFCSPQHTDIALYPIISQLIRAAALVHSDSLQAKLDKLDALLAQSSTSPEDAALIAELLSLPNDGRYPALGPDPQQRRQKTLQALSTQIEALTRSNPLLMIFEDAHWSDPTSLESLDRVTDLIVTRPVLLLVTFRPEFVPPWIGRPHVMALTLNRLTRRDANTLIDKVVGKKSLEAKIREDIIERTDGIPLFVEELTKAVLDVGGEGEAHRIVSGVPSPAMAVPATLQASLMARLDRLGPAKELAQIGAAIGRQFSFALLSAVVGRPQTEVKEALDRLVAVGLLFQQGIPPYASYLFKHALVQDAAYGTLLRERRRELHARIADHMLRLRPETSASQPATLAHHCMRAGDIEKAAEYQVQAGQLAAARSELKEALSLLQNAISWLSRAPEGERRDRLELVAQSSLGAVLVAVKGYSDIATGRAFERASALWRRSGQPAEFLRIPWGRWLFYVNRCDFALAQEIADDLLGKSADHAGSRVLGHLSVGGTYMGRGLPAPAQDQFKAVLKLTKQAEDFGLLSAIGIDPFCMNRSFLGLVLLFLGFPEDGLSAGEVALAQARQIKHTPTIAMTLTILVRTMVLIGDHTRAQRHIDEHVALTSELNFPFWRGQALVYLGWLRGRLGEVDEAIATVREGRSVFLESGGRMWDTLHATVLADLLRHEEDLDGAGGLLTDALRSGRESGERWLEAEMLRHLSLVHAAQGEQAKAEDYLRQALAFSKARCARQWELRAATALARLRLKQRRHSDACELLEPLLAGFGPDKTPDLLEARALLEAAK